MIGIRLIGGLGNQMFQYAAAKSLAKKLNTDVIIDTRAFKVYKLHKYLLNNLQISSREATESEYKKHRLYMRLPSKILQKIGLNFIWYNEKSYSFDKNLRKLRGNYFLSGYFQSEKYFRDIADILEKEFNPRQKINEKNLIYLQKVQSQNSVMLHIRRGDYVKNNANLSFHGLCSIKYYKKAISKIKKTIKNPKFFVFSDDLNWAKLNFGDNKSFIYVEGNKNSPEMDLMIMKNCKNHIIANSSFSWWGAWLGNNKNKIVISPSPWFEINKNCKDLIPYKWKKLKK